MMPVYRYMDSHPNQRNQMSFPQYYYPSYDGIPPHMMVDQAKSPAMYESWPHGSNCAYLMPGHTCGNHGNFPGYYSFQPPWPHFSPSLPHHCCGHHPSFTDQYPVHYPFPPHHWMEQPKYEYDEGAQRDFHCCGCPNHIHNQKYDKGVKIDQEQEPDVEKQSDSLVPLQLKNYSYPMVWIPPEYMKKYNELRKPFESKVADQEIVPHNTKSHGNMRSSEREPMVWNGWSPLDMNSLKSLLQGEDEKRLQNQQCDDKMKQFPYPIFWMPSEKEQKESEKKNERRMNGQFPLDTSSVESLVPGDDEKRQNQQNEDKMRQFPYTFSRMPPDCSKQGEVEKGDQKEDNAAPTSVEETPYSFKFIPVNPPQSDDGKSKSKTNKDSLGGQFKSSQMKENSANQKSIPVKQVVHKEDNSDESEKKVREVTAKKASPPKMSKLPPVCLRVEPLPRKKSGNGSSRSPSPPQPKGRSQEASKDTSKLSASSSLKENFPLGIQALDVSLKKSEEVEPEKYEREAINVADGKTSECKIDDLRNGPQTSISVNLPVDSQEVVSQKLSPDTTGKDSDECKTEEDKGVRSERDVMAEGTTEAKKATGSGESADDGHRTRIKDLSDVEAATLIQSAFRGFELRKLEPLKKLKQMASVHEQLAEVRNRIQALESSDLQNNDKERVVIEEMIMSLLLKLDTIQGLHPNLREFRKALAKELVTLQERLDSLMMKKPKESFEDVSTTKPADDPIINTEQPSLASDVVLGRCESEVRELPVTVGENSPVAEAVSNIQLDGEASCKELCSTQRNDVLPELELSVELPSISEEKTSCEELMNELLQGSSCDPNGEDEDKVARKSDGTDESTELPPKMIDGEPAVSELEKNEPVAEAVSNIQLDGEASRKELCSTQVIMAETKERNDVLPELELSVKLPSISDEKTSSEELMNGLLQGSSCDPNGEYEDKVARKSDGTDESTELPPKMIDGEPAVSELEKNELVAEEKYEIHDNVLKSITAITEVGNVEPQVDHVAGAGKDRETNLLTELPLAVIEDDLALSASEKHKQIEMVKEKVPSSEEGRFNVATNTTSSPTDETPSLNEVATDQTLAMDETSSLNEVEWHSLNVESDSNVKDTTEELPGNAALENEETKQLISMAGEEKSDKVLDEESDHSVIDVNDRPLHEAFVTSIATPESDEKKEDDQQQEPKPNGNEEEDGGQETECRKDDNKMDELPQGPEDTKFDVLVATPTPGRSIEEYDMVMERDKKLLEENAELREMMEKLMEAGKEQSSVISNLTGRVKDLERKLSKKKRFRPRPSRHTKATPSSTKLAPQGL